MRLPSLVSALIALALTTSAACAGERSEADRQRDARDQPQAVLDFAGVAAGMRVADVFGGGGYYAELLQERVGPDGYVLLLNNGPYAAYARKGIEERFADGRLAQIEQRVYNGSDLQLGEAQFDRIVMVMGLHDVWWVDENEGWPAIDRADFLAQLQRALKPGGKLLVVDHAAKAGSGMDAVNALHRIDEDFLRQQIERAGLQFEASSELLRNAEDPRSAHVFAADIRGKTDRFIQLYRRPE